MSSGYRPVKRAIDIAVAAIMLTALSPLLAVIALLVRLRMGSPILFRHRRPGLHGRPFVLWKFRTMRDLNDAAGRPLPDAQRLTSFGRWMRSTSLDELPEFVNVLRGDMSLVGPRPLLMEYLPLYSVTQARRHEVRPGITGLAQINGRNAVGWPERLALDVSYVDHMSLALDLQILWSTLRIVLRRDGISQPGQATMETFQGNANP
jgi:lipopolysaccharide/colanic/teichoic acid biosynthesis glycosyltransferase